MKKIVLFAALIFISTVQVKAGGFFGGLSGASSSTISGEWTMENVSSATVKNRLLVGTDAAVSTFTPTAIGLDDGVTLTNAGVTTLNGAMNFGNATADVITINALFTLPSNAAPRTNVTPTVVGQLILNTGATPDEVCFSTGTTASTWTQIRTSNTPCAN